MRFLDDHEVLQSMMRDNLKIVFVVEHGEPIDDGYMRTGDGLVKLEGLTRSKVVFHPGQYAHPLTYFPTWQEATKI